MFKSNVMILIFGLLGIAVLILAFKPDSDIQKLKGDGQSFAVVELFTSEGCSSCPPADELLANIVEDAREDDKRIFALAFHVDYWNRLGWKDVFSKASYSERQRDYGRALNLRTVYTPQMIVNGRDEFVGSNSAKARSSIRESLGQTAEVSVNLASVSMKSATQLSVGYKVNDAGSGKVLNLAVVERGIVREIKDGENRGRTLEHENVVRGFRTIELGEMNASVSVSFPDDVDTENASIIAYVQNSETKEVLGAQGMDLKSMLSQAKTGHKKSRRKKLTRLTK